MHDYTFRTSQTVYYRGNAMDVSRFCYFHPGGVMIKDHLGEDVSLLLKTYRHSKATYAILKSQFQIDCHDGFVDWSQPIINQVGSLGSNYEGWIKSPVYRPLRVFASDWMEMQTKTSVSEVILYWVPISIGLLLESWDRKPTEMSTGTCLDLFLHTLLVVLGLIKWTLFEYVVHRWIFHAAPPATSPFLITCHFMAHGVHHKVPFDADRLLFPLVPASFIALILYSLYSLYLSSWMAMAVMSGTLAGYVIYDVTHHFLHYGSPREGSYLYFLKRYHNQHHFKDSTKGFGISSNLWDDLLSSSQSVDPLPFTLKWHD
ncbi:unnamed protein product [Nesidiocoris tenuis]|uniref:Cytochrome b5 heme-binding domain-containing protein n=1 Tax=Nesidiocoris tenuis TaxID=355587 RepID=A0A6H5HPY8_9HEMI|nr:unnamed protein product [Nesidiocoris tenuis]CAB0020468.1 unnamed protein product [Nesidiocoris tenuis]